MSSLIRPRTSHKHFINQPIRTATQKRNQKIALWKQYNFLTESAGGFGLKLHDQQLNNNDTDFICWLLKDSPKPLTSLKIRCCENVSNKFINVIGEILKTNTHLVELKLVPSLNDICLLNSKTAADSGRGTVIAEALKVNSTLTTISFYGQGIKEKSSELFAEAFRHNQSLTEINLGSQPLGRKGFQKIIESLQHHPSLTILKLNDINLGKKDYYSKENCAPLLQLLQHNTKLTELYLRRSWFSVEASLDIAKALVTNTSLLKFDYSSNSESVPEVVGRAFVEVIRQNSTLKSLDLSWSDMGSRGAAEMAQALPFNTTLTELKLQYLDLSPTDNFDLTPNVYHAFSQQIPFNYSICLLLIGLPQDDQDAQEAVEIIAKCTERNKDLVAKRTNTLYELVLNAIGGDYSIPEASSSTES